MPRHMQQVFVRLARDLAWRCDPMTEGEFAVEWLSITIAVPRRVKKRMLAAFAEERDMLNRAKEVA